MNILIKTNTSEKIKELSDITSKNQKAYAARHGYKWENEVFDYANYNVVVLEMLHNLKRDILAHDLVVHIGADVLFMNQRIKLESLLKLDDHIVMAYERTGWWIINNDVMLYKNTPKTVAYVDRLIADFDIWMQYPWRMQTHTWNLIQEDPHIANTIRLVEPQVMNQHPTKWQLGDFIMHMYNMEIKDKIALAEKMQAMFPDWEPVWKGRSEGVRPPIA